MSKPMDSLFHRIYTFFLKRIWLFILLVLVVISLLATLAFQVRFEEDITSLIPTTEKNSMLQKVMETAAFSDKIIVHLERKEEGTLAELTAYATRFLDTLSEVAPGLIANIQGRVGDETVFELMDFVQDHLPLYLDAADYDVIRGRIHPDSIHQRTQANYEALISPTGIIAKHSMASDPLGFLMIGLEKFRSLALSDELVIRDGFLVSKDENHLLLFLTPEHDTGKTAANEQLAVILDELKAELDHSYHGKITASYYGGSLIAVANAQQVQNDIRNTVVVALTILLIILIIFYRNLMVPLLLIVPTVFGGLLGIAVLWMMREEISAISLGIGSVLLGVTMDYSLHLLTHIRNGTTPEKLYGTLTRPLLMSSLTTAIAFLCLLFIDARALQDLGIFAAVSVMGASVFALCFIPLVYRRVKRHRQNKNILDRIAAYDFHRNNLFIGGIVLVLIVSAFTYHKVTFNEDLEALNYISEPLKDAERRLDKLTNASAKSLYMVTYGSDFSEAQQAHDAVFAELKQLQASGKILRFHSPGAVLPSVSKQQDKIKAWEQFWTLLKIAEVQNNMNESATAIGFRHDAFEPFFQNLKKKYQPIAIEEARSIPTFSVEDFIAEKDDFVTVTAMVKVNDENIQMVKNALQGFDQSVIIDREELNETLLGDLQQDFNRLLGYCFIFVLGVLFLYYRNWRLTMVTVLPIVITWLITIGIMGMSGMQFNVLNVIISSFIFGLGVDYCIFITNGLRDRTNPSHTLTTHKTSILLSVLTTLLGIGVLIFAAHPALHSIAAVSVTGILAAVIIAFTIQPVLYNLLIFKKLKT